MGKIRIGSPVFCRDGQEAGEVDRVVVDPKSGQPTHIVVRAGGVLMHDVVLPVATLRDETAEGLCIDLGPLELEGVADYVEDDYVSPPEEELPAGAYGHGEVLFPVAHVRATPGRADLPLGKDVNCRDGWCGTVDEVLLDPVAGQVLAFRLRQGGALTRDVVVPVEWVRDARGERVSLDCTVRQLEDLLSPAQPVERARDTSP